MPDDENDELEIFRELVRLYERRQGLEQQLKEVREQEKRVGDLALNYLGSAGYDHVSVDGYTLSPHRNPWTYPREGVSPEEMISALRQSGLGQFVKEGWSVQTLTKYVKEMEEEYAGQLQRGEISDIRECLPLPLRGVIRIEPSYWVHIARSQRKAPPVPPPPEKIGGTFDPAQDVRKVLTGSDPGDL